MKKSSGSRIQDLERQVIEAMKETELVENPHIYHRNLDDPKEPLTLAYKTAEIYGRKDPRYNPFMQVFPLHEIVRQEFPGVIEIRPEYHEESSSHRIHIKIDDPNLKDATQFKYNILKIINDCLVRYLITSKKRTSDKNKKNKNHP
jgi:hypothetical protein